MVIDMHYHDERMIGSAAVRANVLGALHDLAANGCAVDEQKALEKYLDYFDDPGYDKLVKRMDAAGIDVTIVNVLDYYTQSERVLSDSEIMAAQEQCAAAAAKHGGRILLLCGIHPMRRQAPALVRRCLDDYGMIGIKWHADLAGGYFLYSPPCYRILQIVEERGLSLLTHCQGHATQRARSCHPMYLDDIAFDFPGINIVAAHSGAELYREWSAVARWKANVFGDLAGWQNWARFKPQLFRRYLREMLDLTGPGKLMFATDGPYNEPILDTPDWMRLLDDLTAPQPDGVSFTKREVEGMMGGNARAAFKL